jgi:apolipoprotein D and lipocalin family protein
MFKINLAKIFTNLSFAGGLLLLSACTSIPAGIQPVTDFELPRYLGKWYEVARYDHSFERGLEQVTADYSMGEDGEVIVLNRGFNPAKQKWKEAQGKAYFVQKPDVGHLKISFFGPFYASYVIFQLDKTDYQYAVITGPDRDYLWILARTPELPKSTLASLLDKAEKVGFDISKLIWVKH